MTAIAPRDSDRCACGHERVVHQHERGRGWTVCNEKGCGCVRVAMAR
jgi:hypothetical protein